MLFDAAGPFQFPKRRELHERWKEAFWNDVEDYWPELSSAVGCYVFSIDFGKKSKPWYVGLTCSEKGFKGEIFEPHKIDHYSAIIKERRGNPFITLFPLINGNDWSFSRARSSQISTIKWLEKTLIGMALARNPEMRNKRDTRFHREVYVNGVLGGQFSGRRTGGAVYASRLFLSKD